MNKNELIEAVRQAQAKNGVKVLAVGTLNSKSKGELEALLADLSCGGCENDEHCGSCDCCEMSMDELADAVEKAQKAPTRNEVITELRTVGYDGPVSYLVPRLRELLEYVKAGVKPEAMSFSTKAR